jgi:hypothetical protein
MTEEPDLSPSVGVPAAAMAAPSIPDPAAQMPCPNCGSAGWMASSPAVNAAPFVYSYGHVEPRIPSVGVEKELVQFATRITRSGKDDLAFLRAILADRESRYLARQLCWVFVGYDGDLFVVLPRDLDELDSLVEAFASSREGSISVAVGPAARTTGWTSDAGEPFLPRYAFDQLITFDIDEFVGRVPRAKDVPEESFADTVRTLFTRIVRRADNAGMSDEHRALNYVALRYPALYEAVARAAARSMMLAGPIETLADVTPDGRRVVTVRLPFRGTATDIVERHACRVDVTEEFPFLVSTLKQMY